MVQKEVKYWLVAVLVLSTVLISSCSHLPPWAADPLNFDVSPAQAPLGSNITVDVYQWDLIYGDGFVWNSVQKYWEPFSLVTAQTQGNWTPVVAQQTLFLDPAKFVVGENYVAVWACNKDSAKADGWDCNDYSHNDTGRWMLAIFEVLSPPVQIVLPNASAPVVLNVSGKNTTVSSIGTNQTAVQNVTNQTSAPIHATNVSANISAVVTNVSMNASLNTTASVTTNNTQNLVMNVTLNSSAGAIVNVTAGTVTNVSGGVGANMTTTTASLNTTASNTTIATNVVVNTTMNTTTAATNQSVSTSSGGGSSGGASSGGGGSGGGSSDSAASVNVPTPSIAPSRESGTFRSFVKDTIIEDILFDTNETELVQNKTIAEGVTQPSLQAPVEIKISVRWWYGPLFVLFDVLMG